MVFTISKIAEHLARGEGSTFDGVHLTNGYHPLWTFLLVPVFAILPADESARTLASLVQGIFLSASAAISYATLRTNLTRRVAVIGALVWVLITYRLSLSGTEFSLHALCISLVTFVYLRWFEA